MTNVSFEKVKSVLLFLVFTVNFRLSPPRPYKTVFNPNSLKRFMSIDHLMVDKYNSFFSSPLTLSHVVSFSYSPSPSFVSHRSP